MDPNEALKNAREAVRLVRALSDGIVEEDVLLDAASDLADAFAALDEWLARGGFKPDAWAGGALRGGGYVVSAGMGGAASSGGGAAVSASVGSSGGGAGPSRSGGDK